MIPGLVAASHPAPTVAVTVLAALLAVAADVGAVRGALVVVVVLLGQLSIGWSNDWLDAARDTAVARADKPVATGEVPATLVAGAARVSLLGSVLMSLALGPRTALAHAVLVGCGWAYNLGLKSTAWSWAPYALAFGLLPAVVTLSRADARPPAAFAVAAGALLGVGAHLANALPDLDDDAATGVRGLPHRLGRRGTGVLAPAVLLGASVVVVLGPPGPPPRVAIGGLALAVGLVVVATAAAQRGHGRAPFTAAMLVALLDVALFVGTGSAVIG